MPGESQGGIIRISAVRLSDAQSQYNICHVDWATLYTEICRASESEARELAGASPKCRAPTQFSFDKKGCRFVLYRLLFERKGPLPVPQDSREGKQKLMP